MTTAPDTDEDPARVLVVSESGVVSSAVTGAGGQTVQVQPEHLSSWLARSAQPLAEVDLVVLDGSVADPTSAIWSLRGAGSEVPLLLLADPADPEAQSVLMTGHGVRPVATDDMPGVQALNALMNAAVEAEVHPLVEDDAPVANTAPTGDPVPTAEAAPEVAAADEDSVSVKVALAMAAACVSALARSMADTQVPRVNLLPEPRNDPEPEQAAKNAPAPTPVVPKQIEADGRAPRVAPVADHDLTTSTAPPQPPSAPSVAPLPASPPPPSPPPPSPPPPPPPPTTHDLVNALIGSSDDLIGMEETADFLAEEVSRLIDDCDVAVIVVDGSTWAVAGGIGLRPVERRSAVGSDSWLVTEVVAPQRAAIVEDSDALRHRLTGAPLASRRNLMAVPVPGGQALLLLGRRTTVFTEPELARVVDLAGQASSLVRDAIAVRALARRIGPLAGGERPGYSR